MPDQENPQTVPPKIVRQKPEEMPEEGLVIAAHISEDIRKGVYTNLAIVRHSKREFVIQFFFRSPEGAEVVSQVITNPWHAKALATALSENVAKYEKNFGELSMEE